MNYPSQSPVSRFLRSKDFLRLLASVSLLIPTLLLTGILLIITNYRRPPPPLLPDVIHDLLPPFPTASQVNILVSFSVFTCLSFILYFPNRLIVLRRVVVIYSITMLLRNITMSVTSIPDPSPLCPKNYDTSLDITFPRIVQALFGGVTCGDLIFSGHTIGLLFPAICHTFYYRSKFTIVLWVNCIVGCFFIVSSRLHYTVDVILAVFCLSSVFVLYHLCCCNPQLENVLPGFVVRYFKSMEWDEEKEPETIL